jgi:hypothetical protein
LQKVFETPKLIAIESSAMDYLLLGYRFEKYLFRGDPHELEDTSGG